MSGRFARRVDSNQAEIVEALRKLEGFGVEVGHDDILVGYGGNIDLAQKLSLLASACCDPWISTYQAGGKGYVIQGWEKFCQEAAVEIAKPRTYWYEIKTKDGRLRPEQLNLLMHWPGHIKMVRSFQEIVVDIKGIQ